MIVIGCDSHSPIYGALGSFGTGVRQQLDGCAGLRARQGRVQGSETIRIHFHGTPMKSVQPRDISQYLVGKLGEDGADLQGAGVRGPYIESLDVTICASFPLRAIDVGGKCGFVNPDEKTTATSRSYGNYRERRRGPAASGSSGR